MMKIITVNVEEESLTAIEKLVGDDKLYPSRSELVRVALRDFFREEMRKTRHFEKWNVNAPENNDDELVRIPVSSTDENDELVIKFKTYKTYKILRKA